MKKFFAFGVSLLLSLVLIALHIVCQTINLVKYNSTFSELQKYPLYKTLTYEAIVFALLFFALGIVDIIHPLKNRIFYTAFVILIVLILFVTPLLCVVSYRTTYSDMYTFIPGFDDANEFGSEYSHAYDKYFALRDELSSQDFYQLAYSRIDTSDTVYTSITQDCMDEDFAYYIEFFQTGNDALFRRFTMQFSFYYSDFLDADSKTIHADSLTIVLYERDNKILCLIREPDNSLFAMTMINPDFVRYTVDDTVTEAIRQYGLLSKEARNHCGDRGNILDEF